MNDKSDNRLKYTPAAKTYLTRMLKQYNEGKLTPHEQVQLFQDLIDTGMVWSLGEEFSKVATHLIQQGALQPPPSGFIPSELTLKDMVIKKSKPH